MIVTGGADGRHTFVPYEVEAVASGSQIAKINVGRSFTEQEARALLEKIVWPNGPRCGHCGNEGYGEFYDRMSIRHGSKLCKKCGHETSLRIGTTMQSTKLPYKIWVRAISIIAADATIKEVDFIQRLQTVGYVGYKSAGLMRKRILADERLVRGFRRLTGVSP